MTARIPKTISGPIRAERQDAQDGLISYELWDYGPETYHCVCVVSEELAGNAKAEAEFVALALNSAIGALKAVAMAER